MGENTFWYGYLEAGDKSSLVLMDSRLSTGLPETIYIYNQKRDAILEYKRAIVEPKLRELTEEERDMEVELRSAYRKVRNSFTPRGSRVANIPEKARSTPAKSSPAAAYAMDYDEADVALEEEEIDEEESD